MLFTQKHLEGIRNGSITLAFRKWKKAAVTRGAKLKTAVGIVEVRSVVGIQEESLTETDATEAGFPSVAALLKTLERYPEGTLYKLSLRYFSEDPRIALRENTGLSDDELRLLKEKLQRIDRFSRTGPWTLEILSLIQAHPLRRAADLAALTGKEKDWLKQNIRKLKNMGLTISHDTGYTLSPLGAFLLGKNDRE